MDAQPEFVQQPPTEIIARAGADINLIVQVACNSRYSLQWMFGNLLLPGETNAVLVVTIFLLTFSARILKFSNWLTQSR